MQISICVILTSLILAFSPSYAQDLYDINNITTIDLAFTQANWDQLLDDLAAQKQEERLLGTVIVNGVLYDSVGVRYKGNSSYDARNVKNPLNIKLDYIIDQTYEGYGTLKLANGFKDPTMIREVLSYEMARQIMPASQANWAWITINGQDIGLYTSVQDVDKLFVETHFGSRNNAFFKGELIQSGSPTTTAVWDYLGSDSASYSHNYELESDWGWSELIHFLQVFNNEPENMVSVLNVDRHLWMLAYDNLMVNLDAPINFGHNFYLYQDDSGRFNPIIWDLNENFGVFTGLLGEQGPNTQLSTYGLQQLSPYLNADSNTYPIIQKVLSFPQYRKWYVAHMKTLIDLFFADGWYMDRAEALQAIIEEAVNNDGNKFYTNANFKDNLTQSISGGFGGPGGGNIIGISQLMDARIDYLMNLSDFAAQAPEITNVNHNVNGSTIQITANGQQLTSLQLAYRQLPFGAFEKIEMFDDGQHQDGSAGDGLFSADINNILGEVQYYILAENDDAAAFSPALAAAEYYTISTAGNLVINELMASNDSAIADQDGEYDDWIELYNNSSTAIELDDHYLSDEGDNLDKWTFPDTTIEARSYLIIWADEDGSQNGLHANFKLSSKGESLYLSNAQNTLLDNVSFTAQETDKSYGRSPNGIGTFATLVPTWNAENQGTATATDDDDVSPRMFHLAQNYPNPFNPLTTIAFTLPCAANVTLNIYNTMGQHIETLVQCNLPGGTYKYEWIPGNMTSGIYIYQLSADKLKQIRRCLLIK